MGETLKVWDERAVDKPSTAPLSVVEMFTSDQVERYWPYMSRELDTIKPLWDRWWTKEWIQNACIGGVWQTWGVGDESSIKLIFITQVLQYPANKILHIVLAFGTEFDRGMDLIVASLDRYGRSQGCTWMEFAGRPGFERKLGLRRTHVFIAKPIYPMETH